MYFYQRKLFSALLVTCCLVTELTFCNSAWSSRFHRRTGVNDFYADLKDITTPSAECMQLAKDYGQILANFSSCTVSNARPINLCLRCVQEYLALWTSWDNISGTVDSHGNICMMYFTSVDLMEILPTTFSQARSLWEKGNCDNCFEEKSSTNKKIIATPTADVQQFELLYQNLSECFDEHGSANETCVACGLDYDQMNWFYSTIELKYGDYVCRDVFDTMNRTREVWSNVFLCLPTRKNELWLFISMVITGLLFPLLFYVLSFVLANAEEASVLRPRRILGFRRHLARDKMNSPAQPTTEDIGPINYTNDQPSTSARNARN